MTEAESPRADAPAADGSETTAAPAEPTLEERLARAEADARAHQDAFLRARADGENIRKRAQIDVANAHKYAIEGFAEALLPVRDALEAALATGNATAESIRSGVELTLRQLSAAFEKFNVREVPALNEKFDPNRHQAMTMVESDAAPNTVVQVLMKGYSLNERVLRPSMVAVAKARSAPAGDDPAA